MPPISPIPMPLSPWMKVVMRLLPWTVLLGEELYDAFNETDDEEAFGWRKVVVQMDRTTPAGTREDRAQFSFDVVNITAGEVDDTWTGTDYTNLDTPLGIFMGT